MSLDLHQNFQEYLARDGPNAHLVNTPGGLNGKGTLSAPEWEVMRLYQVLQFSKKPRAAAAAAAPAAPAAASKPAVPNEGKLRMQAMMAVKKELGAEAFKALAKDEKNRLTQQKFEALAGAQQQTS